MSARALGVAASWLSSAASALKGAKKAELAERLIKDKRASVEGALMSVRDIGVAMPWFSASGSAANGAKEANPSERQIKDKNASVEGGATMSAKALGVARSWSSAISWA